MKVFLCGGGAGIQTIEANKRLNEIINHSKHFMKFVYILQAVLVLISMVLGVWNFANWVIKSIIFIMAFIIHELLHILVV